MDDKTGVFDVGLVQKQLISDTINEVYDALKERGYNPLNQLVGFLISGDPGYISSFRDARNKILNYDRAEIMAIILEDYLNK